MVYYNHHLKDEVVLMHKIYLDHASTSFPKAPSVADAVYQYLSSAPVNVNRGAYQDAYDTEEKIFETREQFLKLFHLTLTFKIGATGPETTMLFLKSSGNITGSAVR